MPKVRKMNSWQRNEASSATQCKIVRTIFQLRALSSDIPANRKGVYLFYNLPNNFSRQTQVDRSCIVDFFRVQAFCGIVNQLSNFSVTGCCKKYSSVCHDRLNVYLERLLFREKMFWYRRILGYFGGLFSWSAVFNWSDRWVVVF